MQLEEYMFTVIRADKFDQDVITKAFAHMFVLNQFYI